MRIRKVFGIGCVLSLLVVFGLPPVVAAEAPSKVWVNDDWTSAENCGGHAWGVDAFSAIQQGVDAVSAKGIVSVEPGRYVERVVITKSLSLLGPGMTASPNGSTDGSPFAGVSSRGNAALEAVILPPVEDLTVPDGALVLIKAPDVRVDGFTLDGDNPALPGIANIAVGIGNKQVPNNMLIANNIILHCHRYGMRLGGGGNIGSTGNVVMNNRIEQLPSVPMEASNFGIFLASSCFAEVKGNTILNGSCGINASTYRGLGKLVISRNRIRVDDCGIALTMFFMNPKLESPGADVSNNLVEVQAPTAAEIANTDTLRAHAGIRLFFIHTDAEFTINNNTVTGGHAGISVMNCSSPTHNSDSSITVKGGSVSGCDYGVLVSNNTHTYGAEQQGGSNPGNLLLDGLTITQPKLTGVRAEDDATTGGNEITVLLTNNVTVNGGLVGLCQSGPRVALMFSKAVPIAATLADQREAFILLAGNGLEYPADVDAKTVSFLAQGQSVRGDALAAKITDKADNVKLGLVTAE